MFVPFEIDWLLDSFVQHFSMVIGIEHEFSKWKKVVFMFNISIGRMNVSHSLDHYFSIRGNTGWCDSILEIRPLPNE